MADAEVYEVAAVVHGDGEIYGFFGAEDAERVRRWLTNEGNARVRVVVGPVHEWGPMPHDGMKRLEIRNGRQTDGIHIVPHYAEWRVNESIVGHPWERRDDGRLVESLSLDLLRALTEQLLDAGYRVIQWLQ